MTTETASSRWTAQLYGLVLLASALLVVLVVTLLLFEGEDAGFVAVSAVVSGGAAVAVWRSRAKWATGLGLLGTVVSLAMFYLGFGVLQPFSPLEFIVGLTFVLGFGFSLVGGVMGLIRRKGSEPRTPTGRMARIATALIALGAVVSIGGFFATKATVGAAEATGATVLTMEDFAFSPDTSSVPRDGTLLVRNSDAFAHDFKLDELDVLVVLNPGSEALIDLGGLAPGSYGYVCSLHSDGVEGMVGTLTVEG